MVYSGQHTVDAPCIIISTFGQPGGFEKQRLTPFTSMSTNTKFVFCFIHSNIQTFRNKRKEDKWLMGKKSIQLYVKVKEHLRNGHQAALCARFSLRVVRSPVTSSPARLRLREGAPRISGGELHAAFRSAERAPGSRAKHG